MAGVGAGAAGKSAQSTARKPGGRGGVGAFLQDLGWAKAILLVNGLVPLALLVRDGLANDLGANPIEFFTRTTGTLTLVFLLAGLAITPARRLFKLPALIKVRRMVGLLAFAYAFAHFLAYVWLDQFFSVGAIVEDALARPFILVGMLAFFFLVPLAVTSTNGWVKRLGGKRWQRLHKRVYVIAVMGVVHYWLLVKADHLKPFLFGAVLAVLLGARVVIAWRRREKNGG